MLGDADTTAIGSDIAPPDVKARIGDYRRLGKIIVAQIRGARLVEFPGYGHAPQIENSAMFNRALLDELAR